MWKILIVEDNIDILETTTEILKLKGYEVYSAQNGKKGFEQAKHYRPHLIISDISMPIMDGFEMLKAIRSDAKTALTPFIFLTAKTQKTDILRGAVSGADRYLTKPFTKDDLLKSIKEILNP